jgi:hypothetical protein
MILKEFPVMIRPPTTVSKTILHTVDEFLKFVNEKNGKKNIFVNLYHFTRSECCLSKYEYNIDQKKFVCEKCGLPIKGFDLSSFIIDSVVFDIDPSPVTKETKKKSWIIAKRLFYYFGKYERYLIKSGKGFHFYIRVNPVTESDFRYGAKNALKNFQIKIEKIMGQTDPITHGDTSQMIRVPGTYNVNSSAFCMTLDRNHLNLSYDQVHELAEKQPKMIVRPIGRGKKLDLTEYDDEIPEEDFIHESALVTDFVQSKDKIEDFKKILSAYTVNYDKLGLCVRTMLGNEFLDYRQRFLLINILKNFGLASEDLEKIIRVALDHAYAEHSIKKERQIYYVYHRSYGIPACKSGRNLGFQAIGLCEQCNAKDIMKYR